MTKRVLRGYFREEGGAVRVERGEVLVERGVDGRWYWDDYQPVVARRYRVTGALTGIEVVSGATPEERANGLGFAWELVTTAEECARVGLPVEDADAPDDLDDYS